MISEYLSRASAGFLFAAGLALLFAADDILPRIVGNFPASAGWIGQLLAAGWLAVGALNWLSRRSLLGGIYGRPVVLTNAALYFVGTMVLLQASARSGGMRTIWAFTAVFGGFAAAYAYLLFAGPLDRDAAIQKAR